MQWQNRAHFSGIAARLMGRVLLDFARKRLSGRKVTLDQGIAISTERLDEVIIIDEALNSGRDVTSSAIAALPPSSPERERRRPHFSA